MAVSSLLFLVALTLFFLAFVSPAAGESQERELGKGITTGNWPGGIPPWAGADNQCRRIFPASRTDNPCVSCGRGNYCACKYSYPGPAPQFKCFACKTSDICPGNGIKYPSKKIPTSIVGNLRGVDADAAADGSWKSFPTAAPKVVRKNPNTICQLMQFGRCSSGEYCKSVSFDKYKCTKCLKGNKCTGDGKMGPP